MSKKYKIKYRDAIKKRYAEDKDRHNARSKDWYKCHPGYNNQKEGKRRSRMYKDKFEKVDYASILERDNNWCYICEKPILHDQKMNFDHVIPLARGGNHVADNIRMTHAICNFRKHASLLEEMTPYQRRGPD